MVADRGILLSLPNVEQEPWKRQPHEPLVWFRRFERFLQMEPEHSIPAVYREVTGIDAESAPGSWYKHARTWQWENRAAAWDAHLDAEWEKSLKRERTKVIRSRYALQHKRIEALDTLAQKLLDYLDDEDNVWLPDVKAIGTGPNARQVDLIRFNAPLITEIRATLADIAAERGERVKKVEGDLSIQQILPKEYINITEDECGSEE